MSSLVSGVRWAATTICSEVAWKFHVGSVTDILKVVN